MNSLAYLHSSPWRLAQGLQQLAAQAPDGTVSHADEPQLANSLADALATDGHGFVPGARLARALALTDGEWSTFADHWNRLQPDRHMGDGGTYRLRRYDAFLWRPATGLALLPHAPYRQSLAVNPLNGGVDRHFEPLEPSLARHPLLPRLVGWLAGSLPVADAGRASWRIDLHPYRVLARHDAEGRPTPEGRHRDGVDYIVSMMVRRCGVRGGMTTITAPAGRELARRTLSNPLDLMAGDDLRTMHEVSPIRCDRHAAAPAHRDVLVLAFTRHGA